MIKSCKRVKDGKCLPLHPCPQRCRISPVSIRGFRLSEQEVERERETQEGREREREFSLISYSAEPGWAMVSSINHDTHPSSGRDRNTAVVSPFAHILISPNTHSQKDVKKGSDWKPYWWVFGQWLYKCELRGSYALSLSAGVFVQTDVFVFVCNWSICLLLMNLGWVLGIPSSPLVNYCL